MNNNNQIADKNVLSRDRLKFGVASILYQSEGNAFVPIHTIVVRALGGGDVALGVLSAVCTQAGSLMQWLGSVLLHLFNSNKKAMTVALFGGVLFGALLTLTLLTVALYPAVTSICLILYILFVAGFSAATGVQSNVETNWIGDLVARPLLGWFTSFKYILCVAGGVVFLIVFSQIVEKRPSFFAYSAIFSFIAISHAIAIWLMSTVIERKPMTVAFFGKKDDPERINYFDRSLWRYIWFYFAWSGGRAAFSGFITAYMIDCLGMAVGRIALVWGLSLSVSIVMLFLIGKMSDKIGSRKPLIIISCIVSAAMLLWVVSAWWGLVAIIIYQVFNGVAGQTHSMLGNNYGIEVIPQKGRSTYFSFARIAIGFGSILITLLGGFIMQHIRGWKILLFGSVFNHYHIYFLGCALFTMSCIIPLLLNKPKERA
ncbi:MAG: MFS transporter [Verrucomicrobia bacterium]|nr:MFS transporter [Verrucomicrobiota bacterium]